MTGVFGSAKGANVPGGSTSHGHSGVTQDPDKACGDRPAIVVTAKCKDGDASNVKTSWWR